MVKIIASCIFMILQITFNSQAAIAQVNQWEEQVKSEPDNRQLLFELGKYWHNVGGVKEDKEAVIKAEHYLERLIEINNENSLALVYYGSIITMKARDAVFWNKIKFVKQGIEQMDKAVRLDPDNLEVRLVRGSNSVAMPKMMNRLSVALTDFKHIEKLDNEKQLKLSDKYLPQYFYNYGLALFNDQEYKEAREKYLKTVEFDPDSDYSNHARCALKKIEDINYDR